MNEYININDVARAKGLKSTRAIRLKIQQGQYIAREVTVQGGKSYEILFDSLEYDIQALVKQNPEPFYYPAIPTKTFVPDTAKTIALARIDLIKQWGTFRIKYRTFFEKKVGKKTFHTGLYADEKQTDVPLYKRDKLFLEMYNSGEFLKRIFNILGKTSKGTLKRWKLTYDEFGTWESLVPQYKYSSINNHKTILTDEMINIFLKFLLHPNKFSIGKAISLTIQILKNNGIQNIPSFVTFRRYAERFRKHNFDRWTLLREGEKAYHDKVEAYIERDISKLEVGDVLIADGHVLNFQVINPFTGKPTRATLVGIDNVDVRQMNPTWLRNNIGIVLQENYLFSGTIRENIAMPKTDAPIELIIQAAQIAGAHQFISEFPEGYDTVVGERGSTLSGGQRQRIAIARALITNPRIIIFDEATSALDYESESIIMRNMDTIKKGRTMFVIAHRLSTVRNCDVIIALDKGKIIEMGTHDELIAQKGYYYNLCTQQSTLR